MKKRAKKPKRRNIVVPPSPYGFEETVKKLLKVKPPAKKTRAVRPKVTK